MPSKGRFAPAVKGLRFAGGALVCSAFVAAAGFLALTLYYNSYFPVNTWINGIYCTGKTVEQVNEELIRHQELSVLTLVDAEGNCWEMDMQAAGVRPDYTEALSGHMERKGLFSWLEHLRKPVSQVFVAVSYSAEETKLRDCFESLPLVVQERERPGGVSVYSSEEGFCFQDNNAQRLNLEKAYACLKVCLSMGRTSLDLSEAECYETLPDSDADRAQRELWRKICDFADRNCLLAYDMGAEIIDLTPEIVFSFLEIDPESGCPVLEDGGELAISEAGVRAWVEQLASTYDTWGKEKNFQTTRGEVVTVKYVTYGTELDVDTETAYLLKLLRTGVTEELPHVPTYLHQGYVRGLDDIGGTYIEIDLTEQKMYYYVDGVLTLETDVVTGNLSSRRGTPEGINFVYGKSRNVILRGPGYASFVKYWMPVKGGIGIHDASWRSVFGGTIYKTNGSHGCINTPSDLMAKLYEMAEIGTPVVMFY